MQIGSASAASALHASQAQQRIDIAVLGKAQQSAKAQGEAAISLIESAANASQGNFDADGDADGGHTLDVTA